MRRARLRSPRVPPRPRRGMGAPTASPPATSPTATQTTAASSLSTKRADAGASTVGPRAVDASSTVKRADAGVGRAAPRTAGASSTVAPGSMDGGSIIAPGVIPPRIVGAGDDASRAGGRLTDTSFGAAPVFDIDSVYLPKGLSPSVLSNDVRRLRGVVRRTARGRLPRMRRTIRRTG